MKPYTRLSHTPSLVVKIRSETPLIFTGPETGKIFSQEFLTRLMEARQKLLGLPPVPFYITGNMDVPFGTPDPISLLTRQINENPAMPEEWKRVFIAKGTGDIGIVTDAEPSSMSIYDNEKNFRACMIGMQFEKDYADMMQSLTRIRPGSSDGQVFDMAAFNKQVLAHEIAHCGLNSPTKNMEEVIGDRFSYAALPAEKGALSKKDLQGLRALYVLHGGINDMAQTGAVDSAKHLTSFGVEDGYKNPLDFERDAHLYAPGNEKKFTNALENIFRKAAEARLEKHGVEKTEAWMSTSLRNLDKNLPLLIRTIDELNGKKAFDDPIEKQIVGYYLSGARTFFPSMFPEKVLKAEEHPAASMPKP